MNEEIITEHVKHMCKTALENKRPMAVLWYSAGFDDKLHQLRLASVERLFDIVPGGFANISGASWQMFEQKCSDRPGIYVYLRLVTQTESTPPEKPITQEGMVTQNRPHTAKEWKAWGIQHLTEKGIALKPVDSYQLNPPGYEIDWTGVIEAEGK